MAVAVNPDEDEKGGKNRNPLRDWRVWLLIVAVAVIVGVSVGVAVGSGSSSTTNSLGQQQEQLQKEATPPEEVVGEDNVVDLEEETPKDDKEEEKNDAPTQPFQRYRQHKDLRSRLRLP